MSLDTTGYVLQHFARMENGMDPGPSPTFAVSLTLAQALEPGDHVWHNGWVRKVQDVEPINMYGRPFTLVGFDPDGAVSAMLPVGEMVLVLA